MTTTVICGLIILGGLVGIVVPVVPGLLITVGATALWAYDHPSSSAWWVFGIAAALYAVGVVAQYLVPGRRMRREGVGTLPMVSGMLLAIVGFFVVPVVGALLGFVLGIFLVELARRSDGAAAWASTKIALRGVLHSMGIELLAGLGILTTWIVGIIVLGPGR